MVDNSAKRSVARLSAAIESSREPSPVDMEGIIKNPGEYYIPCRAEIYAKKNSRFLYRIPNYPFPIMEGMSFFVYCDKVPTFAHPFIMEKLRAGESFYCSAAATLLRNEETGEGFEEPGNPGNVAVYLHPLMMDVEGWGEPDDDPLGLGIKKQND